MADEQNTLFPSDEQGTAEPQAEKHCRLCHVRKPITEYYVARENRDGRSSVCKTCAQGHNQERSAKRIQQGLCIVCGKNQKRPNTVTCKECVNRGKKRRTLFALQRVCRCGKPTNAANRALCLSCTQWFRDRRAARIKAGKCYCGGDTVKGYTHCFECLDKTRARVALLRNEVFAAYGGPVCVCCGETSVAMLQIDHMDNNGAVHRKTELKGKSFYPWLKKNGYPKGYQILCTSCNLGKHRNNGCCPHVSDREMLCRKLASIRLEY